MGTALTAAFSYLSDHDRLVLLMELAREYPNYSSK